MTSHFINHEDPLRCALGTHLDLQMEVLNKAIHYFETMIIHGHGKKFPEGGIVSIRGTIGIKITLRTKYNVLYLCVQVLNQCYVERTFGIVREMGGADRHPSALHFLFRLARLIISKLVDLQDSNFKILENKELFENAYKNALVVSPPTECKDDDDDDLEPIFDAIERSEVECDALHIIAGTLAAKMNFLDESLGSKDPEIPLKSQSHLQELIDSGFLESIKLIFFPCLRF